MTWRLYGDAINVDLYRISVEIEGVQDLNGFLGIDDTVRAGFQSIGETILIDNGARDAELEKLQQIVDAHCRPSMISLEMCPLLLKYHDNWVMMRDQDSRTVPSALR